MVFLENNTITKIIIPEGVTKIDYNNFAYCGNLASVSLPKTLNYLGMGAFSDCPKLGEIIMPKGNNFRFISSTNFMATKWYNSQPNGIVYLADIALSYKGDRANLKKLEIKEGTTIIARYAFSDFFNPFKEVTSVVLPQSLKNIGAMAFDGDMTDGFSKVTSLTIPKNVNYIGDKAFYKWKNLANVTADIGLAELGGGIFAFSKFENNATAPIYLGKNLLLYKGNQAEVTLKPDTLTIADGAFYGNENLKKITLPAELKRIENYAFYNCLNLASVNLPSKLEYIGQGALGSTGLKEVTIPASLTELDRDAFSSSLSLTAISVESTHPYYTSQNGVLFSRDMKKLIYYPCGKTDESYTLPIGTSIGREAFYRANKLKKLIIPHGITEITDSAIYNCENLTNVFIPASVTSIGYLFGEMPNVVISGYAGSAAQLYCESAYEPITFHALSCDEVVSMFFGDLTVSTLGAEQKVIDARTGYNSMPIEQQIQFPAAELAKLEAAEAALDVLLKKSAKAGDIDNDGKYDVSDIIGLRNLIMNTASAPSQVQLAIGDLDVDTKIDVSDVVMLRNRIMSGTRPAID